MIRWLRAVWQSAGVALLAIAAFLFAVRSSQARRTAHKWEERATRESEGGTVHSVREADQALKRADRHHEAAEEAAKRTAKALDKIAEKDDAMADIVDRWRKSDRLRGD